MCLQVLCQGTFALVNIELYVLYLTLAYSDPFSFSALVSSHEISICRIIPKYLQFENVFTSPLSRKFCFGQY